jgi:hypothetical protein
VDLLFENNKASFWALPKNGAKGKGFFVLRTPSSICELHYHPGLLGYPSSRRAALPSIDLRNWHPGS